MSISNLEDLMEKLDWLESGKKAYVKDFFSEAPEWVFQELSIKEYPRNTVYIREYDPVTTVYILLKGWVKAHDYRILGIQHEFTSFKPVHLQGSMEMLLELPTYQTTLVTVEHSVFLAMNSVKFMNWIKQDSHALLMETKDMGRYLLESGRRERALLLLKGKSRILMVLDIEYAINCDAKGNALIYKTQQEISDYTGVPLRTVRRCMQQLEEEGFLTNIRGKILITREQHEVMAEFLDQIIIREKRSAL